ncbi:large ribosomal subunit protein bL20m isoform X2 [Odocoileus virginianus]|uniref:Large ribosomal subunit protein bL20m isoform X2 n=1 Tax=Odocoileus virginianus TaxID=9874 RepID=A0ABM4IQY8_ODOVR
MVFLSAPLWLRNRITDRYWRVQEVLKHARHFRGRKNRCYRLAVRAVTRAFVQCTRARSLKKRNLRTLWINRITAASQEHGLKYPAFILNLIKCQVGLALHRDPQGMCRCDTSILLMGNWLRKERGTVHRGPVVEQEALLHSCI